MNRKRKFEGFLCLFLQKFAGKLGLPHKSALGISAKARKITLFIFEYLPWMGGFLLVKTTRRRGRILPGCTENGSSGRQKALVKLALNLL